jgi:hypothetical protein
MQISQAIKIAKYDIDINNSNIDHILHRIIDIHEHNFIQYIKILYDKYKNENFIFFRSQAEHITCIMISNAPQCTKSNALMYAYKYFLVPRDNILNKYFGNTISLLSNDSEDIYTDYISLIKNTNIYALKSIQQILFNYLLTKPDVYAYKNYTFENNIYTLMVILAKKVTKYNFDCKFSGVIYPYQDMQWIYNVNKIIEENNINTQSTQDKIIKYKDLIKHERYTAYAVMIGFIEYIITYLHSKKVKRIA